MPDPPPPPPPRPAGPPPPRSPGDDAPVLPDLTDDERNIGWGDPVQPDDDERYLREVPPHHGG